MAVDFAKPATSDNYSTQFVPNLQANVNGLAQMLDSGIVSISGTIPVGVKRYNATSTALEEWSGSAWVVKPLQGIRFSSGNLAVGVAPVAGISLLVHTGANRNVGVFDQASQATVGAFTDAGAAATLRVGGSTLVLSGDGTNDHARLETNGRLIIGGTGALGALHAVGSSGALFVDTYSNDVTAPSVFSRKARGTAAVPAAVQTDDILTSIQGAGYHSGAAWGGYGVAILGKAAQGFTSTAQGSYLAAYTTPLGSTTRNEAFRVDPDGRLLLARTTSSGFGALQVVGGADLSDQSTARVRMRSAAAATAVALFQNSASGTANTDGFEVGLQADGVTASLWNYENGPLLFANANTERARFSGTGLSFTGASSFLSMDAAGLASPPSGLNYGLFAQAGVGLGIASTVGVGLWAASVERLRMDVSGHFFPVVDVAQNSGGPANRWNTVFAQGLSFGNASEVVGYSGATLQLGSGSYWTNVNTYTGGVLRTNVDSSGNFNIAAGSGALRLNGAVTRSEYTGTLALNSSFSSSVPRAPDAVEVYLECLTAEANWSVGQRITWPASRVGFTGGYWLYCDAAGTNFSLQTFNTTVQIPNAATGAATNITPANWRIRVRLLWL